MIRAIRVLTVVWPLLTIVAVAVAQQPPVQPNPEATALGQMVMDAAQREAGLRVQLNAALAKVAASETAAKPATPPPASEAPKP